MMTGGRVQQVCFGVDIRIIEVLSCDTFERQWRRVGAVDIREGDVIAWQSATDDGVKAYLTRADEFTDRVIGECRPCERPTKSFVAHHRKNERRARRKAKRKG